MQRGAGSPVQWEGSEGKTLPNLSRVEARVGGAGAGGGGAGAAAADGAGGRGPRGGRARRLSLSPCGCLMVWGHQGVCQRGG